MAEQQRQPGIKESVLRVVQVAQIGAALVPPLLHKAGQAGENCFGGQALVSLVAMTVVITLVDGPRPYPVGFIAAGVAVLCLLNHRLRRWALNRRGIRTHSQYTGPSIIPGPEGFVKSTVEPVLLVFAGLVCGGFSPGLGVWLFFMGISQAISVGYSLSEQKALDTALQDAQIEAEWRTQRLSQ